VGASLADIRTPQYGNLTANDPAYFQKATTTPNDWIGQRIIEDSPYGEASYLTAAKFLPPIADYIVVGDVHAPVKGVVTMDGKIKRSDGHDAEPPSR
jgi:hypothetical protein